MWNDEHHFQCPSNSLPCPGQAQDLVSPSFPLQPGFTLRGQVLTPAWPTHSQTPIPVPSLEKFKSWLGARCSGFDLCDRAGISSFTHKTWVPNIGMHDVTQSAISPFQGSHNLSNGRVPKLIVLCSRSNHHHDHGKEACKHKPGTFRYANADQIEPLLCIHVHSVSWLTSTMGPQKAARLTMPNSQAASLNSPGQAINHVSNLCKSCFQMHILPRACHGVASQPRVQS